MRIALFRVLFARRSLRSLRRDRVELTSFLTYWARPGFKSGSARQIVSIDSTNSPWQGLVEPVDVRFSYRLAPLLKSDVHRGASFYGVPRPTSVLRGPTSPSESPPRSPLRPVVAPSKFLFTALSPMSLVFGFGSPLSSPCPVRTPF